MWTVEICYRPAAGFAGVDSVVDMKPVVFPSRLVHLEAPEGKPCHQRGSFRCVKLLKTEVIRNASQVMKEIFSPFSSSGTFERKS